MDIEIGGETFHKEPNLLEQIAYRDTWGRGADSFIAMIYERLILMRDLMHSEGSISSNHSGEGDIRRALIEADLVDCMVALPGQLFYSTQISEMFPKAA